MTREESLVHPCPVTQSSRRRFCRVTWLSLGSAAFSGCGLFGSKAPPPPQPVAVTGSLQAADDLNPSVSQRPSPLTLRIFELKSAVAFEQADFMALYRSEQTVLGADVLAREEVTLQPGENKPYNKLLNAETRFIAVFGAYRNLEKSTWRAIAPVMAGAKQKLVIRADALAVSVKVSP